MRPTAMRRIPHPTNARKLVAHAFRIEENSSGKVRTSRNKEMTGRRDVESVPPPEPGIRSAIRTAQMWIVAENRSHTTQPI